MNAEEGSRALLTDVSAAAAFSNLPKQNGGLDAAAAAAAAATSFRRSRKLGPTAADVPSTSI